MSVTDRRSFLRGGGLVAIGGLLWGGYVDNAAPDVHSEVCTGCGLCERACITEKASIFVLPRKLAMGEASRRYVRGWDTSDEERLRDVSTDVTTKTIKSEKSAVDYLNNEDFFTKE